MKKQKGGGVLLPASGLPTEGGSIWRALVARRRCGSLCSGSLDWRSECVLGSGIQCSTPRVCKNAFRLGVC